MAAVTASVMIVDIVVLINRLLLRVKYIREA